MVRVQNCVCQHHLKVWFHLGYVLDGIPTSSTDWKPVPDQVQLLQELDMPPDVIINLKVLVIHIL